MTPTPATLEPLTDQELRSMIDAASRSKEVNLAEVSAHTMDRIFATITALQAQLAEATGWRPVETDDAHPERTCQKCHGPNVVWFVPNELWNRVVGSPDGILCPVCFVKLAEEKGHRPTAWCLLEEGHPGPGYEQGLREAAKRLDDEAAANHKEARKHTKMIVALLDGVGNSLTEIADAMREHANTVRPALPPPPQAGKE